MKFFLLSFKKSIKRLSPRNGFKKPIVGGIKSGTKLLAAGPPMGGGAELASHLISQGQTMGNGSNYVLMEDFGPSLVCMDSIESSTSGRRWYPGFRSPVTMVILFFVIIVFICIPIRCCMRKCIKKVGLTGLFRSKPLCYGSTEPLSPPCQEPSSMDQTDFSQKSLDMESEYQRLENGQHPTCEDNR